MKTPFFSIIIPVYCVEDYLSQCVDRVLSQSFRDLEVILVDDGSPDKCPEMCDNYCSQDDRIKVIHKKNGGLSDARNVGIRQSTGKVILFLDSDDYFQNDNFLEDVYSVQTKGELDVVLCGCIVHDLMSEKEYVSRGNYNEHLLSVGGKEQILNYLSENGLFPGSAWVMAVKRAVIEHLHLEFPLGLTAEDYYWVENVLHAATGIGAANNAFYVYNINRSGSITTRARVSGIKGIMYAIEDWLRKQSKEQGITNFLALTYLLAMKNYASIGKSERASIKDNVFYCFQILSLATGMKYKIASLLFKIFGPLSVGKIVNVMYNVISKR